MDAFQPDKAAEHRQQAEMIRSIAAQVSLLEAKVHLLEAAQDLEEQAADEGGGKATPHDPTIPLRLTLATCTARLPLGCIDLGRDGA